MLPQLDELLLNIVAVALGDENRLASAEEALARLELQGWQMRPVIERIWAGERDPWALCHGLDEMEAQLVTDALAMLELSNQSEPARLSSDAILEEPEITAEQAQALQTLLLNLPVNVRLAVIDQEPHALRDALQSLPDGQRQPIVDTLLEAGLLENVAWSQRPDDPANGLLDDLEPVLWAVASATANADAAARMQVQEFLAHLEGSNGPLGNAVLRIWDGERDFERLTAGLSESRDLGVDPSSPDRAISPVRLSTDVSARAIQRILEMLHGLTGDG